MSRFSFTLVASALLLAACDSGVEAPAQQQDALSGDKQVLAGEIDRSFAGEPIPALTFSDPTGNSLDLSAPGGTPVLVNLWATWCAPCVVEMPLLDELAQQMEGRLKVVTVSQDLRGADLVAPFFAERDFAKIEPWLDPEGRFPAAVGGDGGLPLTVLYDASGRELFRVAGGYDWASEEAIAAIEEALVK